MRKILVIGWLISSGQVWCDSPQCDPSCRCSTNQSICVVDKQADGTVINRWACWNSNDPHCSNGDAIKSALSEENWKDNTSLQDYSSPGCAEVTDGPGHYAASGSVNFSPSGDPCPNVNYWADQKSNCCFIRLLPTTTESNLCAKNPAKVRSFISNRDLQRY